MGGWGCLFVVVVFIEEGGPFFLLLPSRVNKCMLNSLVKKKIKKIFRNDRQSSKESDERTMSAFPQYLRTDSSGCAFGDAALQDDGENIIDLVKYGLYIDIIAQINTVPDL